MYYIVGTAWKASSQTSGVHIGDDGCSVWSKRASLLAEHVSAFAMFISAWFCNQFFHWLCNAKEHAITVCSTCYISTCVVISLSVSVSLCLSLSLNHQKQRKTPQYFGSPHAPCWWSLDCLTQQTWRLPSRLEWKYIYTCIQLLSVHANVDIVHGGSIFMILHLSLLVREMWSEMSLCTFVIDTVILAISVVQEFY